MFTRLKLMFAGRKHKSKARELMFTAREHKKYLRQNTFPSL